MENTKILLICGSPRPKAKSAAYAGLLAAQEGAQSVAGVDTDLVELFGRKIAPCIHCNKCLRDDADRCTVFHDDMDELYDKFFQADGIIISCPVYDMNVTAQFAQFYSRFRSSWKLSVDDPAFFQYKVGAAIAVGGTRNGGQESVIRSINNIYATHGINICPCGGGIYGGAMLWNPGDGSTAMDDPAGLENCRTLGAKLAQVAKALKAGRGAV
ncbi:flavodoxin family protein [Pseudoflavonifractor sp. 524-17]|uniref:flavodoxin family protein n=1 Tax=Pseudoflavonifractor sp. 524-17 TaxID=2304577 RepID=UPI00137B57AD|nr:flavodoxin family protein [Pseudoflavonifractor sp. 524-17]NCE65478.1 flavodoxin family protein [Pseudoflavonifractor sp. 524-17]